MLNQQTLLRDLRTDIFGVLWDEPTSEHEMDNEKKSGDIGMSARLALIMEKAYEAQKKLDDMKYSDNDSSLPVCNDDPSKTIKDHPDFVLEDYALSSDDFSETRKSNDTDVISLWLKPFEGMEVINEDWIKLLEEHNRLSVQVSGKESLERLYESFDANVTFAEENLRQLVFIISTDMCLRQCMTTGFFARSRLRLWLI